MGIVTFFPTRSSGSGGLCLVRFAESSSCLYSAEGKEYKCFPTTFCCAFDGHGHGVELQMSAVFVWRLHVHRAVSQHCMRNSVPWQTVSYRNIVLMNYSVVLWKLAVVKSLLKGGSDEKKRSDKTNWSAACNVDVKFMTEGVLAFVKGFFCLLDIDNYPMFSPLMFQ